jgi:hypothetical protein
MSISHSKLNGPIRCGYADFIAKGQVHGFSFQGMNFGNLSEFGTSKQFSLFAFRPAFSLVQMRENQLCNKLNKIVF